MPKTLDKIAQQYKTDKASNMHNYTARYDMYFSQWRDKPIKILEIGIQNGYSLKTWKEYFSKARIYGIDIVDCSAMDEDRIKTLQGSQTDLEFLRKVTEKYGPFDIIIDDGSHVSSDMRTSFDFLFPYLKRNGLYIVEDLHCCYWPQFKENSYNFMDRLKELMDCVNARGKSGLADPRNTEADLFYQERKLGEMNWWEKNIEYIHLFRSIVFIKKSEFGGGDLPKRQIHPPRWLSAKRGALSRGRAAVNIIRERIRPTSSAENNAGLTDKLTEYRKHIRIYDIFIFNNELELLELRLNILHKYVDYFVVVEATKTFTGLPKKLMFADNQERFSKFKKQIIYLKVSDLPENASELKKRLQNRKIPTLEKSIIHDTLTTDTIPQDQDQWLREFYQKESMKKALVDLRDDDICFISDIDEIWNPELVIDFTRDDVFKLKQTVYSYFLNNRSSEQWAGTIVTKYKNIKHTSINHLDGTAKTNHTFIKNGGWHFTNQGGADRIRTKLESYGHQEFNNAKIKLDIENKIRQNKDFVGRNFKFWIDEENLPKYLTKNRTKYKPFFK